MSPMDHAAAGGPSSEREAQPPACGCAVRGEVQRSFLNLNLNCVRQTVAWLSADFNVKGVEAHWAMASNNHSRWKTNNHSG